MRKRKRLKLEDEKINSGAGKEKEALMPTMPYQVYYSKSSKGFDNFDDMFKFLKELKEKSIVPDNIKIHGHNMRRREFQNLMRAISN